MQDRKTYAKGVTNVTAEAKASIGMPVVDGEDTVASESTLASFAGEIPESGSMLVTLEVNGTVIAYREMYTIDPDEGYIQVGDYSIANDSGSVTIETMEGGDVVRLKVEPVTLEMNDVFRAAVSEVAPKSEGGGSGGGELVVTVTTSGTTKTMDKTWQEIADADVVNVKDGEYRAVVNKVTVDEHEVYLGAAQSGMTTIYTAPSADGYPVSSTK